MVLKMIQMAQMDENPGAKGPSSVDDTNLGKLFTGKAYLENGELKEYANTKESELRAKEIKKSQAWKNYETFSLGGVKTLKSILISAAVRLNPFNIPEIANLTGRDNIDLGTIGDHKTILFVIIPQAYSTYNFIVSMMYSQLFDTLYYKAEHTKPTEENPDVEFLRLKYHVRFMMDEFANIGKIPEFPTKISTMRKYNISCTVVLQSLAQIKAMYKDDYETIIGNCDTNILLGTQEQTTADYYSKQLGCATIRKRGESVSTGKKGSGGMNFGPQKRELMTMDEIRTMPPECCLVFVKNVNPFYDKKYPLEKHPRYKYTGDVDSKNMFDITKEKDENGKIIFLNSVSDTYADMSVAPPDEGEETLKAISMPKNIEDTELGNKEEPDDPKVKLAHIMDLDSRQEGRQYKIAQFNEVTKKLNIEVATQKKSGKKEPSICIYVPQVDFNDIPMFTRMAFKKYNAPVLIFTNDLTVSLYTSLIGYYIDKNGILKNVLSSSVKGKEAYRLEITPEGATVCAAEKEGLFNGVQTLRQLIIQYGSSLPCLYIEDYPALSVRGWFMDVTRGRIPKMTYLKELADRCSLYKINQLHLYIEHTFLFDGLSEVWRDDTPLTAQDILEFDAYCAERNIELVPSVATFGHLYKVLRTKTFHELSEVEEAEGTAFSFYERMCHHTLNSTDDRAYELVCRLIDEYSPLFRSNLFNINCDETFDLGRGRGKERADEIGSHVMYVQWVNRVCEHVKALGKRPMFWGDIIAAHPEAIKELPEDVICMTWDYSPTPREINVKKLWENGAHQYLCPGVQGWNQAIHQLDNAYENIKQMAAFAHKYDGEGLLNTDWGDFGHFQHPELSMVGIVYGAAFSWNSDIQEKSAINADISVIEYGDRSASLVEVISHMSKSGSCELGRVCTYSGKLTVIRSQKEK